MCSVAEVELGASFVNGREAIIKKIIMAELGHPHTHTTIVTENTTVEGVIKYIIQPKMIKIMDMLLHWLHGLEAQDQFEFK